MYGLWILPAAGPSAFISGAGASIKSVLYPTLCLDVPAGAIVAGANVVVLSCWAGGECHTVNQQAPATAGSGLHPSGLTFRTAFM
jgi:hypothetical protein